MATRIYWIHHFGNAARVGTMARPRGNDWLEDEIISCRKLGTDIIVCLLEQDEINELGLGQEEVLCRKHGIQFFSFPIRDRSLPPKSKETDEFIRMLHQNVLSGQNIVIHCRMGIGRASIIAGSILQLDGQRTANIIATIIKVRGLKVPDTEEQLIWLKERE